ncbi:DsbA family protein [Aureimonas mangrovi]|uniref:DsbA family protein n=1 Tax=Aureimonas mangrovi TaxID=2758041 RepID=UPI001FE8C2F7|nr:DsbA family protein [Aureimonas mangrovi]
MTLRALLLGSMSALVLGLGAAAPASAQEGAAQDREAIEAIVRDYLIREPEVLLEALDALEAKRAAETQSAQSEAIESAEAELVSTPDGTALGNPDGDVTLVEFFDYNCGFCKRAHADMNALIEGDPQLRVVLKEIPVLGPQSEEASRVSLAVREIAPQRYGEFQSALLSSESTADEAEALRIATGMGLDEAAVREALAGPAVTGALQESARLASLLQINGTPSYVVGDLLVPGAVGAETLSEYISNVRECGSASC